MFGDIKNSNGERIDYSFHPAGSSTKTLVVIGHGVTGNKERPFIVALANALADAGIPALRISFSGNGASEGRFVDSTISKETGDLGAVIDALAGHEVVYAGHSMGGAVGVLRASTDARIKRLISLAGMVHTKDFAQREFGSVKPGAGYMWDDENCPLSQAFVDDLTIIGTVAGRAGAIKVPWLLVHGTEDDVVPVQDSRDIFAAANEPKQLIEIPGCNHVFTGEYASTMIQHVIGWLKARGV